MANKTSDGRGPGVYGISGNAYGRDRDGAQPLAVNVPEACFDWDGVPPDIGPYVLDDDVLQVQFSSNGTLTVIVNYAILTRDNGLVLGQERFTNLGVNAGTLFSVQLREGFLVSLTVVPSANVGTGGYAFVSAGIRRLTATLQNVYQSLCAGYCYTLAPLSYPGSGCVLPSSGGGCIRVITGSVPAAGADISETIPSGVRREVLSLRATLTTAIAVGSRQVKLTLDDGANRFYDTADGPVQAASLAWAYCFAPIGSPPANTLTDVVVHYDNAQMLEASYRIRTVTANIQAADQWTAPIYAVREWQGQL